MSVAADYMNQLIKLMEHPTILEIWLDFISIAKIKEPKWIQDEHE